MWCGEMSVTGPDMLVGAVGAAGSILAGASIAFGIPFPRVEDV